MSNPATWSNAHDRLDLTRPHGRVLYDFHSGIPGELTLKLNEIVFLTRNVDENWLEGELKDGGETGIFPAVFVEIIVALPEIYTETSASGDSASAMENFPPETYAIVVVSHVANSAEELSLDEGATVTILSKRGTTWIEAMDDYGNVGFCPTQCLEIIGSEPDEVRSASRLDDVCSLDSFKQGSYGSSGGSVSPTFSGELESSSVTSASVVENKRSSWHNDRPASTSSSPTAVKLDRGRMASLQHHRGPKKDAASLGDSEKREKVIREIITTEKDFLGGLRVCLTAMRGLPLPVGNFPFTVDFLMLDCLIFSVDLFTDRSFERSIDRLIDAID